jgi:hypothetical protein
VVVVISWRRDECVVVARCDSARYFSYCALTMTFETCRYNFIRVPHIIWPVPTTGHFSSVRRSGPSVPCRLVREA